MLEQDFLLKKEEIQSPYVVFFTGVYLFAVILTDKRLAATSKTGFYLKPNLNIGEKISLNTLNIDFFFFNYYYMKKNSIQIHS